MVRPVGSTSTLLTSTSRTARCGPACRVVWQGRGQMAVPYADCKSGKVTKALSPLRTAFAALRFPHSGPAPWARRDGPSLAQHGSPGIHAGRPTAQNLLSASRRGGQIKSTARRGGRPAGLVGGLHSRSVAADEPCEAALGLVRHCDVALVESACTVNQALRMYLFCDRCAIERSLVLLVNCYVEG